MNPDARQSAHGIASNSWSQLRLSFLHGFLLGGGIKDFLSKRARLSVKRRMALGSKTTDFLVQKVFHRFSVEKRMRQVENCLSFPQDNSPSARLIPRSLTGPAKSSDV